MRRANHRSAAALVRPLTKEERKREFHQLPIFRSDERQGIFRLDFDMVDGSRQDSRLRPKRHFKTEMSTL